MGLEVVPYAMCDLFEMTNCREHREHSLNQHTRIPPATRIYLQIGWVSLLGVEMGICQDDHLVTHLFNEGLKDTVMHIGGVTVPAHNEAELVQ